MMKPEEVMMLPLLFAKRMTEEGMMHKNTLVVLCESTNNSAQAALNVDGANGKPDTK